jgi:hypothetical protein
MPENLNLKLKLQFKEKQGENNGHYTGGKTAPELSKIYLYQ